MLLDLDLFQLFHLETNLHFATFGFTNVSPSRWTSFIPSLRRTIWLLSDSLQLSRHSSTVAAARGNTHARKTVFQKSPWEHFAKFQKLFRRFGFLKAKALLSTLQQLWRWSKPVIISFACQTGRFTFAYENYNETRFWEHYANSYCK